MASPLGPLGLGLPNLQWEPFTPYHLTLAESLHPAHLLALAYPQQPTRVRTTQIEQIRSLLRHLPNTKLILRMYHPTAPQLSPASWAEECADLAQWYDSLPTPLEVIPGNEMNFVAEGGHEDYDRHDHWLSTWSMTYRGLRPLDTLHLPAPWPGPPGTQEAKAKEWWWQLTARETPILYDLVDVHEYGAGFGLYAWANLITKRPVMITEWNEIPPASIAQARINNPALKGAIYFILDSHDPTFDNYSLVRNHRLREAFRQAQQAYQSTPPIDGGSMTILEWSPGAETVVPRGELPSTPPIQIQSYVALMGNRPSHKTPGDALIIRQYGTSGGYAEYCDLLPDRGVPAWIWVSAHPK